MTTNARISRPQKAKPVVRRRSSRYVAVIGDLVHSRRITGLERRDLQRRLEAIIGDINQRYAGQLAAKFLITLGDEFQGLLKDPTILPALIRRLDAQLPDVDLRLGIGKGTVHTDFREFAIGMDGPVWHAARYAIEQAKANRRLGGVFSGFSPELDLVLNGLARLCRQIRSRLTSKQLELLNEFLEADSQVAIAKRAGVSRQAVSKQVRAAGGDAYREGEIAWRAVLSKV